MGKVFAYARVSTPRQGERGVSLLEQRDAIINDREFENSAFFGLLRLKLQGEQTGSKELPLLEKSKTSSTLQKKALPRKQQRKKVRQ